MAESLIALTEGSGAKNLHTFQRVIGTNTVEDQVVLLGEPYLASYTNAAAPSTATVNSHLLQIMAGASLKVRIRRIEMYQRTVATAAAYMTLAAYRLTTAGTGGTSLPVNPLDMSDAAAGATSQQLPTVKGTEAAQLSSATILMMQTIGVSTTQPSPQLVWDFDRPRSKPLIIPAGAANGIAIKTLTAVAGGTVDIFVWLDEGNF